MAQKKRLPITRKRDLATVARLYCQGRTQAEIGKELGITQQQVCYDLKDIQKQWLESSLVDIDTAKARELAKLDHVEREHWLAWARSQSEGPGDARFLDGVLKCVVKRCEILGLNAPTKISGPAGGGVEFILNLSGVNTYGTGTTREVSADDNLQCKPYTLSLSSE